MSQFVTLTDLPQKTQDEIAEIQAVDSARRTASQTAFLAAHDEAISRSVTLRNADDEIVMARGKTVPTTETGFQKGALFIETDVTGATTLYENQGDTDTTTFVRVGSSVGSASGQVSVQDDGTVRLEGDATSWEDLRIAAESTRAGGTKDPDFAVFKTDGSGSQGVFLLWFDKATEEELYFSVQLPHAWKQGSDLYPHVHWTPAANGGANECVRWGLEYTWANVSGTFGDTTIIYTDATDGSTATVQGDESVVAGKHYISAFDALDATDKTLSSMLVCRVFRDATDSTDDYNADAGLLEIDFHYQIDAFGSDTEYGKE